jgi:hypothetical protein
MDLGAFINQIDQEISALQLARAALNGFRTSGRVGRPKATRRSFPKSPTKRAMSAEARANMAAGQRARHAKAKMAAKKEANVELKKLPSKRKSPTLTLKAAKPAAAPKKTSSLNKQTDVTLKRGSVRNSVAAKPPLKDILITKRIDTSSPKIS